MKKRKRWFFLMLISETIITATASEIAKIMGVISIFSGDYLKAGCLLLVSIACNLSLTFGALSQMLQKIQDIAESIENAVNKDNFLN